MLQTLWLVPTVPLISAVVLMTVGKRVGRRVAAVLGAGSVGISAAIAVLIALSWSDLTGIRGGITLELWTWFAVDGLTPAIGFHLDSLSLLMTLVVTVVGFLIHLYSVSYMADDEGFSRFFAYMNLFVSFMLVLVLGNNLLVLLIGWEGVGLCSYLLIGFWYKDPVNGSAARKAFVVTRIGDTALLVGLFLLFWHLNTFNIQQIILSAGEQWPVGSGVAVAVAALLLGGAVGKSAQLPLQTWLPDAMAGPTPTSALIHAATMVTAGVYLIARMHVLFELAPVVQTCVTIVGAATLLIAGFSAMAQTDIKRVLAYSTISQIGYMFLALGVGAYSAAMFHFMTHAFFKALLFLAAGVVILAMHHEQNMSKMGGLRRRLPVTFWTFLIGSLSLAAVPLVSSGFYSKDHILWLAWSSAGGAPLLWLAGLVGALVTALYTFRMVFLTFFGPDNDSVSYSPPRIMSAVLVVLAVMSTFGGFIELPQTMGHVTLFSGFMHDTLPEVDMGDSRVSELLFQVIAAVTALLGIYAAYRIYGRRARRDLPESPPARSHPLIRFWAAGFGFDWLYDRLLVRPYYWAANVNRDDMVDSFYAFIAGLTLSISRLSSGTQTGRTRNYAFGIALGAAVMIALVMVL